MDVMEISPHIYERMQSLIATELSLEQNPDPAMAAYFAQQKRQFLSEFTPNSKASRTNKKRIRRAATALEAYQYDFRTNLNELLLDIQALCDAKNVSFAEVIDIACGHR